MVFNVVPTILEISMVAGILAYKFGAPFAWVTSLAVAAYIAFTLIVTQWRTKFRQTMNKADNDASSRAIDSLINYETVKYFTNEAHEVKKYDEFLQRYEDAALKTQSSLAFLNFGQNIIFSTALSTAMILCSQGIMSGTMTVGDLLTMALGGPRFIGKSTILRLLYRFYDCQSGAVLFNDTIFHNIHYGRLSATEEEVYSAARHAAIHDTILRFPEQYQTRVGERGLKARTSELYLI